MLWFLNGLLLKNVPKIVVASIPIMSDWPRMPARLKTGNVNFLSTFPNKKLWQRWRPKQKRKTKRWRKRRRRSTSRNLRLLPMSRSLAKSLERKMQLNRLQLLPSYKMNQIQSALMRHPLTIAMTKSLSYIQPVAVVPQWELRRILFYHTKQLKD